MIHQQLAFEAVETLARRIPPVEPDIERRFWNPFRFTADMPGDSPERAKARRANLEAFLSVGHVDLFVIGDFGLEADVGETGVPMVSPSCIAAGRVSRLMTSAAKPLNAVRESVPLNELWRTLIQFGIEGSTICWNAYPFVPIHRKQPGAAQMAEWAGVLTPFLAHHLKAQIVTVNDSVYEAVVKNAPEVQDRLVSLKAPKTGVAPALAEFLRRTMAVA